MHTIFVTWMGARLGDANFTQTGELAAKEIYDLWSEHHTLSEFNSPTYAGVSMWALSLWTQYAPAGSVLRTYGAEILNATWYDLSQLYNVNLKNLAGPWDRSYGYRAQDYVSLVAAVIWGAVGREYAPFPAQTFGMYHQDDFAFYPLFALAMPSMVKQLTPEVTKALTSFQGEHMFHAQAFSPPFDTYPRNITTWLSENVTIGAESIAEKKIGGPATSNTAFNPAVIQWAINDYQVGYISLFPTESSIYAVAAPGSLYISYPNATAPDSPVTFQLVVSEFTVYKRDNLMGLNSLPGLSLNVTTNAMTNYSIIYNDSQDVNNFVFYNVTYEMAPDFTEVPFIHLEIV